MMLGYSIITFCCASLVLLTVAFVRLQLAVRQEPPTVLATLPPQRRLELAKIRHKLACEWLGRASGPTGIMLAMRELRAAMGDMQRAINDLRKQATQ